jgi:hypothetical protein
VQSYGSLIVIGASANLIVMYRADITYNSSPPSFLLTTTYISLIDAMAGTVSLESGLLEQLGFAWQSGIKLYKTVQSVQTQSHPTLGLLEELDDLKGILSSFTEAIGAPTDMDLSALRLPLLRCGNACAEFEQEILKCLSRPGGNRTNFQNWANLRYMGDDIYGFRQLLARYKSTINIARTDANLQVSVFLCIPKQL